MILQRLAILRRLIVNCFARKHSERGRLWTTCRKVPAYPHTPQRGLLLTAAMLGGHHNWLDKKVPEAELMEELGDLDYCRRLRDSVVSSAEGWQLYVERPGVWVWRKEHESKAGLYRYKLYGHFQDVTVWEFLAVQLDLSRFRLSWDSSTVSCQEVATDEEQEATVYYWQVAWPTFFSNRDYCCIRQHLACPSGKLVIATSSIEHPDCPQPRGTWRVEDYSSMMAVSPTQGPNLPGLEFSLTMFEDPGVQLPESMMSWVAMRALPDFIANLRLAAIRLRTEGGQASQGLRLPEQLRSRANSTLLDTADQEPDPTAPEQPTSISQDNSTMGPPGKLTTLQQDNTNIIPVEKSEPSPSSLKVIEANALIIKKATQSPLESLSTTCVGKPATYSQDNSTINPEEKALPAPSGSQRTPAPELVTPPPSPSRSSEVLPPPYLSTPSGLELSTEAGLETPPATPKRQVLEENNRPLSEDKSCSPTVMTTSNSSEDSFIAVLNDSEGGVMPADPAAGARPGKAMASPVSSPMRVAICSLGYREAELELILYEERCIARETVVVERRLREVQDSSSLCEELLHSWLHLVHRKSKVFHRRMMLELLGSEEDLSRKQEMLDQELRQLGDSSLLSTEARRREALLLAELVEVVEARDALERRREEEQGLEQEEESIGRKVELVELEGRRGRCKVQ